MAATSFRRGSTTTIPHLFGGEYYFDNVKVNPWTFAPERYGEPLTPLRAYAHDVPRYYMQDFGNAVSHPNTRFYCGFVQNTFQVTRNLTLNLGLRYDLQTFEPGDVAKQSAVRAFGKGADRSRITSRHASASPTPWATGIRW